MCTTFLHGFKRTKKTAFMLMLLIMLISCRSNKSTTTETTFDSVQVEEIHTKNVFDIEMEIFVVLFRANLSVLIPFPRTTPNVYYDRCRYFGTAEKSLSMFILMYRMRSFEQCARIVIRIKQHFKT